METLRRLAIAWAFVEVSTKILIVIASIWSLAMLAIGDGGTLVISWNKGAQ